MQPLSLQQKVLSMLLLLLLWQKVSSVLLPAYFGLCTWRRAARAQLAAAHGVDVAAAVVAANAAALAQRVLQVAETVA
jgi:hypothetical protein